jgi:PmbA protein
MTSSPRATSGFAFEQAQFQQIVEDTLKIAVSLGASDAGAEDRAKDILGQS